MPNRLSELDATPPAAQWPLLRSWIMGADPLPFFEEARRDRPVLRTPEVTLAFSFADCTEILRRYDLFSVALYKPKQSAFWMAQARTLAAGADDAALRPSGQGKLRYQRFRPAGGATLPRRMKSREPAWSARRG